jgi:gamma-glutamylcyclotransferase (GGCT)/AIG2-like uncharacterized protein YtfP
MKVLYFAYGRNTNRSEMKRRIPSAKLQGNAVLPGFTFQLQCFANITKKKYGVVMGVLWEIPQQELRTLDSIEAYYSRHRVSVYSIQRRKWETAEVYFMKPRKCSTRRRPLQSYVNYLREGYRQNGLTLGA